MSLVASLALGATLDHLPCLLLIPLAIVRHLSLYSSALVMMEGERKGKKRETHTGFIW